MSTSAPIHLPDVDDDTQRLLNHLLDKLEARQRRNLLRASYYDGKNAIKSVGTVIPPAYWQLGIVLGWSAKAVDILARRCNLAGFVWADGDLDSLGARQVWEDNFFAAESSSAMVESLIHGPSFLINTQGDEDEPRSLIHVKNALNATGDWDPRARRLENLLSITDRDSEGNVTGLVLYLDGETIVADKDSGKWSVDKSSHSWGVPAEPLVYKYRPHRPFGSSRISRAVMSLHQQALRTVVRMEAHNDVYAIPDLWLFGADESIFKNADGSQKASWQVVMGRIKGVPDDDEAEVPRADVKQFPASSPQPHIDALRQQAQLFSGETSIPLTSLGVSDMSNPTSADSYIASREDLIAEAEGATADWSPAFRRSMVRALAIANGEKSIPEAWQTIDTKFRSPVYLSAAAEADAGSKKLGAVPWLADTQVGLELLGLSDQQIERAMAEKRRATGGALLDKLRQQPQVTGNGDNANGTAVIAHPAQ